jgi:hypothetical protein
MSKLEPVALTSPNFNLENERALLSIAISLKRIADAVDPPDKSRGTFFEQADNWFNHWISIWRNAR